MENNKIYTYIGFAIKSRKIRCGFNSVATLKGKVPLLLLCKTASDNTFDEVKKIASRINSKIYISTTYKVEDLVNKENCKLIAIQDYNLAKAIIENGKDHIVEYSGGYSNEYWRKER